MSDSPLFNEKLNGQLNEQLNEQRPWICAYAWDTAYYSHDGRQSPCCRYQSPWDPVAAAELSAEAHPLRVLRDQMLVGEKPASCLKCIREEEAGIESKRELSLRYKPEFLRAGLKSDESISAVSELGLELGNLCNLRCVSCHPISSSAWNREAASVGYDPMPRQTGAGEKIRSHLATVKKLDLLGGETFLSPQLKDLLTLIVTEGNPGSLFLQITTNVTIFPSAEIRALLGKIGMVRIHCSVDAYGARNEYIRYPSRWEETEINLRRYLEWRNDSFNVSIYLQPTISAYSYPGLPELFDWWSKLNKEVGSEDNTGNISYSMVTTPDFQAVGVLPRSLRENVARRLMSMPAELNAISEKINEYALERDAFELRDRLWDFTGRLDALRGLSSRETVPEIFAT